MRALLVLAVLAATCLAGCRSQPAAAPAVDGTPSATVSSPGAMPTGEQRSRLVAPPTLPSARTASDLAARIEQAEETIADPSSTPSALRSAGELEQLASRTLAAASPRERGRVMSALRGRAAAVMRANVAAASGLGTLTAPEPRLPRGWRIVAPLAPSELMRLYRTAQRRTGVPWQYLAAVNFVETKFGRVVGPSTAGAQGPMQFMPATWDEYGAGGDITDPHDAIPAAARMLAANGAPDDMAGALRAYNDSASYVRAVTAYAGAMRRWPRAFLGYWSWRVLYKTSHGTYALPVGYPKVAAARLAS